MKVKFFAFSLIFHSWKSEFSSLFLFDGSAMSEIALRMWMRKSLFIFSFSFHFPFQLTKSFRKAWNWITRRIESESKAILQDYIFHLRRVKDCGSHDMRFRYFPLHLAALGSRSRSGNSCTATRCKPLQTTFCKVVLMFHSRSSYCQFWLRYKTITKKTWNHRSQASQQKAERQTSSTTFPTR